MLEAVAYMKEQGMMNLEDEIKAIGMRKRKCHKEGTTMTLTYAHPSAARAAVDTYDRGDLNGHTIRVRFA